MGSLFFKEGEIMLLGYEEMYPGYGMPLMSDHLEPQPYLGKDKIVNFLTKGEQLFAKLGHDVDVFSGETIPISPVVLQAGGFEWPAILAYYVDKYNLRLPKDFEDYILNNN